MIHPIFSVLISRPELVVDHVANYAALVRDEASSVGSEVAKRAIAWGVAVMCFVVFLVLAGVAAMLGVMLDEFRWVLVIAPGVALALALVALAFAQKRLTETAFTELRSQLDADANTLRTLGAKS